MRPFFTIMLSILLLCSSSLYLIFPIHSASADNTYLPGSSVSGENLLGGPLGISDQIQFGGQSAPTGIEINGAKVDKVSIKSDYGLLKFGQDLLKFNGVPRRTLVYGSGDAMTL